MKRSLLASVSMLALTVAASAADLPAVSSRMPYKAPIADPAWSWTGFYLGANGGVLWHRATANVNAVFALDVASSTANATGAIFGGQVGYNWQSQAWVYGVEADWNWVNSSGTGAFSTFPAFTFTSKISSLATGRGRLGYAMGSTGAWLPYVTGGIAVGQVNNSVPLLFGGYQDNRTKVGWTVGGGIEHMFAPHWTAKVEALYVDLGTSTVQGFLGPGYTGRFRDTALIARAGVNYKW